MASISTKSFYFTKFGGYSGLQHVLKDDFRDIEDLNESELVQPGLYKNLRVNEILSHGRGRQTVEFTTLEGTPVHSEFCNAKTPWWTFLLRITEGSPLGAPVDIRLIPTSEKNRYIVGYLFGKFYLINPAGAIILESNEAYSIIHYCRENNLANQLRAVRLFDIRLVQERSHDLRTTEADSGSQTGQVPS